MKRLRAGLWFWAVWLLVGMGVEVWAVWFHPAGDDTLSEFTVFVFRASTTVGWFLLMILMGFLAAWFPGHVRHLAQMKAASEARRRGISTAPRGFAGISPAASPLALSALCALGGPGRHADWCPHAYL